MAREGRCAGRKAGDGKRCRRVCRTGERYCAQHHPPATAPADRSEPDGRGLYDQLLGDDRRAAYETALSVRSLEPEIALLRVLIGEHAEEPDTVRKLVATLVRAVQLERSLQQDEAADLAIQVQAFLTSIEILVPPNGENGTVRGE